jgi:hypothetical protein
MFRPNQLGGVQCGRKFIYIVWNIWKEHYRRVFDNQGLHHGQLEELIHHDVRQWQVARKKPLEEAP